MIKLLVGIFLMISVSSSLQADQNLSHEKRDSSLEAAVSRIKEKVKNRKDLPHITVEKQLDFIDLLAEFGLGRFLLERGGLNGFWTDYVMKHPVKGRLTSLNDENKPLNTLEDFLLNKAPTILATQQRSLIFKEEIQKRLQDGVSLASVPCGLMADLLDLDFTNALNVSLTGIDLDAESIKFAKEYAKSKKLQSHCEFSQSDAWNLKRYAEFDLIASNGLSIYVPDDEKVIELYKEFFKALKPGGYLVTSFLTPPPAPGSETEWKLSAVNKQDALMQKIVFGDILECKWQVYRSEKTVVSQLKKAGFNTIKILYDNAHIFPTIIAKKPLD